MAMAAYPGAALPLGVAAGIGSGLLIGAINGALVAWLRLPSFLVTLATMGLFAGVARSLTQLRSIPVTDPLFTGIFGSGSILGVPSLVIWCIIGVAVGHLVYRRTRFGAHVLATGDNSRAAQVSGIEVPRIRLWIFMISGGLAGLAGLLYAGRLQAAKYTLGETDLMTVIAAVIVGGTLLNGGKGSIIGALVGSLLMGMLNNGLILMGLSVSDQMIVRGLIILAAVAVSLREKTR
jgi:ribose transport system permease protein